MGERDWVRTIQEVLNGHFKASNPALRAEAEVALPYGTMITGFDDGWKPRYAEKENNFKTDLLIYEQSGGGRIPRLVIEAKILDASTHDVITYGKKSVLHRELMPYLRYGLMIGANKSDALTWKHFTHGSDFDFMFSFGAETPDKNERESFLALVDSEVATSRELQGMLDSSGSELGIYYVRKKLEVSKR